jgi:hypothetical protein
MSDHNRDVCDAQLHATLQDYLACPHCVTDDDLWNLAGTPSIAWADACRELYRRLVEVRRELDLYQQQATVADDRIQHLEEAAKANAQIFQGEQAVVTRALSHLEKIYTLVHEADEEFNFTGDYDPDGAPDAPDGGR